MATQVDDALRLVATVPDFPEPGVLFRDLNPVIADPVAFATVVDALAEAVDDDTQLLAAVEARGFLFAAALAYARGLGIVPVRKPGKLPSVGRRIQYTLEYGSTTLELPSGAITPGSNVLVVDDVLATGGTAAAVCELVEGAGGIVQGLAMVLELSALHGRERLPGRRVHTLRLV
ncbi:MAG: adenine phosphoribosyltransferase [Sciscionella sp.]